jgi:hypothetical protein
MSLQKEQNRMRFSKLRQRLRKLADEIGGLVSNFFYDQPIIKGTVIEMKRKCGKENCRCNDGMLHVSKVISSSISGKTRMRAIPKGRLGDVEKKVERYQKHRKSRARLTGMHREMLEIIDEIELMRREEMEK